MTDQRRTITCSWSGIKPTTYLRTKPTHTQQLRSIICCCWNCETIVERNRLKTLLRDICVCSSRHCALVWIPSHRLGVTSNYVHQLQIVGLKCIQKEIHSRLTPPMAYMYFVYITGWAKLAGPTFVFLLVTMNVAIKFGTYKLPKADNFVYIVCVGFQYWRKKLHIAYLQ